MGKYKRIIILVVVILLFGFALCLYLSQEHCFIADFLKTLDDNETTTNNVVNQNQFKLETRYIGNNTWNYSINGELPNICYSGDVSVTVAESYPEKVFVIITVTKMPIDVMCTGEPKAYFYEGTFNASEEADIELDVKLEDKS